MLHNIIDSWTIVVSIVQGICIALKPLFTMPCLPWTIIVIVISFFKKKAFR